MIPVDSIERAAAHLRGRVLRTPLVELELPERRATVLLKLECLQPIGSFKLRGALAAMESAEDAELEAGVVTASAGNMAQGVAWAARDLGIPCTVVVPEHAPRSKVAAVERLGGRVLAVPFEEWWEAIETSRFADADGLFIHPVQDPSVMAGNGTIGLEIAEDCPDADAIVIPFGGGGLTTGIASAVRERIPAAAVYTVEPRTASPLAVSMRAGEPRSVEYEPSFVDGAGGRAVLEPMWPGLRELVDDALAVDLDVVAEAVRVLAGRAHVVAEGAGALALAAVLAGLPRAAERPVCVVSGANIDPGVLATILVGETP